MGGVFANNESPENGGVFFGSDNSFIGLNGGTFEHNNAEDGGVVVVDDTSTLQVDDGVFTGNVAQGQGGVFSVNDGGSIQVRKKTESLTITILFVEFPRGFLLRAFCDLVFSIQPLDDRYLWKFTWFPSTNFLPKKK